MKKIVLMFAIMFLVCGCNSNENSLVKDDYINKNGYDTIYSDLKKISEDISYFPSEKLERNFYEMIEVISDNCDKFSNLELTNLYNLINNNYSFKYNNKRYNNDDYNNDLNMIKKCLTE